jgi:methylmalonyl-CoA mutase C-terminal domain/subunit
LHENGLDDVLVVAGGIIPDEDVEAVRGMGVDAVFGPGTNTNDIIRFIRERVGAADAGAAG